MTTQQPFLMPPKHNPFGTRFRSSLVLIQDPRHNRLKGTETKGAGYKVCFCDAEVTFEVAGQVATVVQLKKAEFEGGGDDGRIDRKSVG